ncbi:MAG: peptidylprolyl isomerase [Magnetovibrio sp.]|nr:peptidylprolyl isomerase [Magnetovibrio sp.]
MKRTQKTRTRNHQHTMMHHVATTLSILALVLSIFVQPHPTAAQGGLGIAAVVNDDAISMLDLNARIALVLDSSNLANTPENRGRIARQVLKGLIDERLKLQEARSSGITMADKDINLALADIAKKNKISVDKLKAHLETIGAHISSLKIQIESQLAWNRYIGRKLAKRIQIGDEEINDEINRIQSNAGKPEYLLAEIFVPVETPSQESEVRNIVLRLLEQMKQGATFSGLARNFSQAPSAALDGDLGWVQFANLDPKLQNVVPQLTPGRVSSPIRTPGGYHLVLLRKVRTSPGLAQADAALKISQYHVSIAKGTPQAQLRSLRAQLIATTQNITSCAQMNEAAARSGSLMSGSLGELKLSTLPDNMKQVLSTLQVGQKSQPIETGGGLAVMMVCERTDEGADMEKTRDTIRKKLLNARIEISARRKLRDLHREAFVDIRL